MLTKPLHPLKDKERKEFSGYMIHSNVFEDAMAYKGKKVLVVSSSVSASKIASALTDHGECALLHNSVPKISYHLKKATQDGSTVTSKLFICLPAWLNHTLPPSMAVQGLKATVLKNFPGQITPHLANGRSPGPDAREASVLPTVNYMQNLKNDNIVIQHRVVKAKNNRVFFADDASEKYDVVSCGTGYEPDVSFLPEKV